MPSSISLLLLFIISRISCFNLNVRSGTKQDSLSLSWMLAKELMNPIVDPNNMDRFLVAYDKDVSSSEIIACCQIRPLGSAVRDPRFYSSRPGSYSVEQEVDDEIWDELQSSGVQVPGGVKSLPWAKEYKEYAEQAKKRRERRLQEVLKRKRDNENLYELASVFVKKEYRNRNIGSHLVQKILERHKRDGKSLGNVYLLTLRKTSKWYRRFGFQIVEGHEVPQQLDLEILAGALVTRLIGEEVCCMKGASSYN